MSDGLTPKPGFSTDPHLVAIPRDFISACAGISSDAILLLLHFFSGVKDLKTNIAHLEENELLESFSKWHGSSPNNAQEALEELIDQGLLLKWQEKNLDYLIAGTPEGRFFYQELELGVKQLNQPGKTGSLADERPNIFKLYETHIGIITPMMAEQLKQDESDFPADWIEDAIREAVQRNARNWKYVKAILLAWKERGRDRQDEGHQSDIEAFRKLTREQQERSQP